MKLIDLTGKRFGHQVVIRQVPRMESGTLWEVKCDCGNIRNVRADSLSNGNQSCGCLRAAAHPEKVNRGTVEYKSWGRIKHRVSIGAAEMCERWSASYDNFLLDMGRRPSSEHTIDRIDSMGAYGPDNCRWATPKEQARNRTDNHIFIFNGQYKCIAEWAELYGISNRALWHRLVKRKWPIERALTEKSAGAHNAGQSHDTKRKLFPSEYNSWKKMKQRCLNINDHHYSYYGGRGITVCDGWLVSFAIFIDEMGARPDRSFTLDRIDPNLGYYKENCRWADRKTQSLNKRNTRVVKFNGETVPVAILAEKLSISSNSINCRIKNGWSADEIIGYLNNPRPFRRRGY